MHGSVNENVVLAIAEQLAYSTVAIPILESTQRPEHGSGAAISYQDRHFIATAAHIVGKAKELHYVSRPDERLLNVGGKREVTSAFLEEKVSASGPHRRLIFRKIHFNRQADLALIELDPDHLATMPNVRFIPLPRLTSTTPPIGSKVFLIGFAEEAARTFKPVRAGPVIKIVNLYSDYPTIVANRNDLSDFDSRHHFLMDYPFDPSETARPYGLSGCGIWKIPQQLSPQGLWSLKDPELVGIQTHWYPGQNLLKAARIETLTRLILGIWESEDRH